MRKRTLLAAGFGASAAFALAGDLAEVVPAGTTSGTAGLLAESISWCASCASGAGARISDLFEKGDSIVFENRDATNACLLYPPTGGTIALGLANAPISVAAGTAVHLFSTSPGHFALITYGGGSTPVTCCDYENEQYLADQASVGAVLTFTFAQDIKMAMVEISSSTLTDTGRARTDGVDPTTSTGAVVRASGATPIFGLFTTVKVLAPSGTTVSVYGYW